MLYFGLVCFGLIIVAIVWGAKMDQQQRYDELLDDIHAGIVDHVVTVDDVITEVVYIDGTVMKYTE